MATLEELFAGRNLTKMVQGIKPGLPRRIPDGYPVKVVDQLLADRDVQLERYPIAGLIDSSQLINWPADASLRTFIVDALNLAGHFEFDHLHGA